MANGSEERGLLPLDVVAERLRGTFQPPNSGDEKETLAQLYHCLGDDEGVTLLRRHQQLGLHFLSFWREHMDLWELPFLARCLEVFAKKAQSFGQYRDLLVGFLGKACRPIAFRKTTELLPERNPLPDFLTSLGRCAEYLGWSGELQLLVLEVAKDLLERPPGAAGEVGGAIVRAAAAQSELGAPLLAAARSASDRVYCRILQLLSLLVSRCSYRDKLLSLGLVEILLRRIHLDPDLASLQQEVKQRTYDLFWDMLLDTEKTSFEVLPLLIFDRPSLLRLKEWFRRDVVEGSEVERRQIGALLLGLVLRAPRLDLETTLFMQDICLVATATELGTAGSWAEHLRFGRPESQLQLKKALLTLVAYKFHNLVTQLVAEDSGLLGAIALLLDLDRPSLVNWSCTQRLELAVVALRALPIIAGKLYCSYTQSGATFRILKLVQNFSVTGRDMRVVKLACWCLARLAYLPQLYRHLIATDVPSVLISLVSKLIDGRLTVLVQEVLDQAFQALGKLGCGGKSSGWRQDRGLGELGARLLCRLQAPAATDSKLLDSLIISAGEFVWECVILNDNCRRHFIDKEGIYMVLNLMEVAKFPIQLYYLGLLAESCSKGESLPQIVTWRGKGRKQGVLSMICALWREQEARKRVLRDAQGCIKDIECPLMGSEQRNTVVEDFRSLPALVETLGCLRPRAASVVFHLSRKWRERADLLKSVYLIPFDQLGKADQITLEVIQYYEDLKEGEMFLEVERALDATRTRLAQLDVTVLHNLLMRHVGATKAILRKQLCIMQSVDVVEKEAEERLYDDIRESEMMRTLDLGQEVKRVLRLSDPEHILPDSQDQKDYHSAFLGRVSLHTPVNYEFTH